jgi:hypothetical protein
MTCLTVILGGRRFVGAVMLPHRFLGDDEASPSRKDLPWTN